MRKVGPAIGVLLGAVAALALAGCGGKDGDVCEADILVAVTVTGPEGDAVPDVTVTLDELPCTDTGDGIAFECVAPEAGDYNVYGLATGFESHGQLVTVEEPADCDTPGGEVELLLARESGV